jgi:hypothetical protein
MEFPWVTVELLLLLTVARLPSQTLTPSPTELSEALTTLTPFAPSNAVPDRFTLLLSEVVTVELFAAMAPPAGWAVVVAPAVTLSIWLSLMACALLCLVDDGSLLWPKATPKVSAEAARRVQRILFTVFLRCEHF